MGVKGLIKLLAEHAPESVKSLTLGELRDWVVAVDASIALYQWCAVGRARNIVNRHGAQINHIQGAFYRTVALMAAGIMPMYVFDGAAPLAKAATMQARRDARANGAAHVGRGAHAEVAQLLRLMKVPVLQAPAEAEAQCAQLSRAGIVDAIVTEDTDVLAFGGTMMVRGVSAAAKTVSVVTLDTVLAELGLTQGEFVDLCILLGTDYTTAGLPGVGRKAAYRLIKEHRSIEAIIEHLSKKPGFAVPAGFDYKVARAEFLRPKVTDAGALKVTRPHYTPKDISAIRAFLVDTHGMAASRVDKRLTQLMA